MHEVNNVEKVLSFIRAGNATFTLHSDRTGKHYTYKVRKKKDQDNIHFVSVSAGTLFNYIGSIWQGWKFKAKSGGDSVLGFDYFWRWMIERNQIPQGITFYHEGRCGKCGRPLTDPTSIERGLGPDCAGE